ncbi:hypothetical protein C4D60_Mb04t19340 [Musa balbisiana]|uniref:Uncharacterized protein n=1 Tax=Musa balbisiana TaxID=52838 RepID=A0A4S8KD66_MUSBA|nr:hypothetical protein C4D60_Mb04t19340 [Musa balbisiana]
MARELYTSSSEVLLGKSAKSLLWHYAMALMDRVSGVGRVIDSLCDRNTELHKQIEEIRMSTNPEAMAAIEQHASDLEAEAARAEVRLAKGETLTLTQKLDEARAEARTASETLADKICQRPEKDKKLIKDYKKSKGFELGLTRTGQVTYEYGYRIALACFRARYPDLEVAEDPFASFPEDLSIDMPEEVPFDDSTDVPEK